MQTMKCFVLYGKVLPVQESRWYMGFRVGVRGGVREEAS